MSIRVDFKEVEAQIGRLIGIANQFWENDGVWSHLKNREDWERVYALPDGEAKRKIERLYADGRDISIFMCGELQLINSDYSKFPTLSSVVARFEKTWVYLDLSSIPDQAEDAARHIGLKCWSFEQMVDLFRNQMDLLRVVRSTLETLKTSTLFRTELEERMASNPSTVIIQNVTQSAIAVGSSGVTQSVGTSDSLFQRMLTAVAESDASNKEELTHEVQELRESVNTPRFLAQYQKFMAVLADHFGIFGPFLAPLSKLLGA